MLKITQIANPSRNMFGRLNGALRGELSSPIQSTSENRNLYRAVTGTFTISMWRSYKKEEVYFKLLEIFLCLFVSLPQQAAKCKQFQVFLLGTY